MHTNQNLNPQRTAAIEASEKAAKLPANFTYTNVTSNTTVTGVAGLNVVDITGSINLSNASLKLSGPAGAYFVVNVGGSITLGGSGGIEVGGSVEAKHVIINVTGEGLIHTAVGNVIEGTLLGPMAEGELDGTLGSLLLGENFSLLSDVHVMFEGCDE